MINRFKRIYRDRWLEFTSFLSFNAFFKQNDGTQHLRESLSTNVETNFLLITIINENDKTIDILTKDQNGTIGKIEVSLMSVPDSMITETKIIATFKQKLYHARVR